MLKYLILLYILDNVGSAVTSQDKGFSEDSIFIEEFIILKLMT